MPQNSSAQALSQALIETLQLNGDLDDPLIEAAFRAVPRHDFLPELSLEEAYANEAVPVKLDEQGSVVSSASQPSMVAAMLRQLHLRPGDNVLEIGTGTGYNAAMIQHIVGQSGNVTSVELEPTLIRVAQDNLQRAGSLASRVTVVQGDGASGYAARAQYDRIIASVGVWDVPDIWTRQLKPGGILVAPIWVNGFQMSAAFDLKSDGTLFSSDNVPCGFISMRGIASGPPLQQRITTGSSLCLMGDDISRVDGAALHLLLSDDQETARLGYPLTASEYWYSLLPYLALNTPESLTFVTYSLDSNQLPYGLADSGFALIGPASSCFVPYHGEGIVHCFAGADTFLALDEAVTTWDKAGRPHVDNMRLRLVPLARGKPSASAGKVFLRSEHYLHIWLDTSA